MTLLCLSVAACASTPDPYVANAPKAKPVENRTSVSDALVCMDDMFKARGFSKNLITIKVMADQTGNLQAGHRDMLISAISKMSRRSNAFTYIDYQMVLDPYTDDVKYTSILEQQNIIPTLFLRGAMSQLDEGVTSVSKGGGVRAMGADIGASKGKTVSIITMDLHVGVTATGALLHRANSRNSIAFSKKDKGLDGGAEIAKNGVFFQFAISESEGMAQAVRTLIEFTAIETLGKLANVPYWRCLGMSAEDPEIRRERQDSFERLSSAERISFAQRALAGRGLWRGRTDGASSPDFMDALAAFQTEHGLQSAGSVDFATYSALDDASQTLAPNKPFDPAGPPTRTPEPPKPLKLSVVSTSTEKPKLGDIARVRAQVSDDAYLYCFYRDGLGQVARIFPNRWQPDALVRKSRLIEVPAASAGFDVKLETPGVEESIACFASRREFGPHLPAAFRKDDLEPIQAGSFQQFADTVLKTAGPGAQAGAVIFKVGSP